MRFCILFTMIIMLQMLSCKQEIKKKSTNTDDQVSSLTSQKTKEQFLENLFASDQSVRDSDIKLEILKRNNYDHKSKEYQNHLRLIMKTDSINFLKALKYLQVYNYPNPKDFSSKANYAIYTIFLHQSYQKQLELFPYILRSYKKGFINNESFSFLLNKMYIHKFGTSHPQAITDEKNIRELLKKLKLEN